MVLQGKMVAFNLPGHQCPMRVLQPLYTIISDSTLYTHYRKLGVET